MTQTLNSDVVKQITISGSEARQGKTAKRKIETYHNAVRSQI